MISIYSETMKFLPNFLKINDLSVASFFSLNNLLLILYSNAYISTIQTQFILCISIPLSQTQTCQFQTQNYTILSSSVAYDKLFAIKLSDGIASARAAAVAASALRSITEPVIVHVGKYSPKKAMVSYDWRQQ